MFNVLAVAGERNETQLQKNNFEEAEESDETVIEANERPVEVKVVFNNIGLTKRGEVS